MNKLGLERTLKISKLPTPEDAFRELKPLKDKEISEGYSKNIYYFIKKLGNANIIDRIFKSIIDYGYTSQQIKQQINGNGDLKKDNTIENGFIVEHMVANINLYVDRKIHNGKEYKVLKSFSDEIQTELFEYLNDQFGENKYTNDKKKLVDNIRSRIQNNLRNDPKLNI